MFKKFPLLISISFFTAFSCCLAAQEANAEESTQSSTPSSGKIVEVKLRIIRLAYSNYTPVANTVSGDVANAKDGSVNQMVTLWYKTGLGDLAAWKPMHIRAGERSMIFNYVGPQVMKFYTMVKPATEIEPPVFREVTDITIPEGAQDLYLLMRQNNSDVSFYAMNVSPTELPRGKAVIMNMTQVPLAISLGEQKPSLLRKGSHTVFSPRKSASDGSADLLVAYYDNEYKEWKPALRSTVSTSMENRRYVYIIQQLSKDARDLRIEILDY